MSLSGVGGNLGPGFGLSFFASRPNEVFELFCELFTPNEVLELFCELFSELFGPNEVPELFCELFSDFRINSLGFGGD